MQNCSSAPQPGLDGGQSDSEVKPGREALHAGGAAATMWTTSPRCTVNEIVVPAPEAPNLPLGSAATGAAREMATVAGSGVMPTTAM